jgi:hypothetical protein
VHYFIIVASYLLLLSIYFVCFFIFIRSFVQLFFSFDFFAFHLFIVHCEKKKIQF